MKVLLVVPRYSDTWGEFYHLPLGLGYIASAIRQDGHDVSILNLNHIRGDVGKILGDEIRSMDPDVCATGALSPFLSHVREIFSVSRQAKRDILNIAGGGVVSGEPGVILQAADIDIGVVGEGEETACELLSCVEQGGDLHDVRGIVFRDKDGRIVQTPERAQIRDLGALPWPDYEMLRVEENIKNQRALDNYFFHAQPESRPRSVDMVTSRSCPFKCTFCFHPTGKVYRERPLDDFFAELDTLVARYNINMVGITDELFSLKKSRLLEFCRRIKPYGIQWLIQLHVKSATEEAIRALRDSGCVYISYGIESMSQPILESMKKRAKIHEIEYALKLTYDNKIGIQGNLLFGDSEETLETANESMHWWSKNRRYQINLTRLMVFPGSPDYLNALRDGLLEDKDRLAFVNDIPTFFNITRMNDKNLEMMHFQTWVFARSLLNMAPLVAFEVSDDQVQGRDTAYDIVWDCPRCDHRNDYLGVVLPPGEGITMRLTCRDCFSRWDIRNMAYRPKPNVLSDARCIAEFHRAAALIRDGACLDAVDLLESLVRKDQAFNFNVARVLLGEAYRRLGDMERMVKNLGFSLRVEPVDPDLHCRYADALCLVGAYGAARLHYAQALMLDPDNTKASEGVAFIDGPEVSERQRATYYVSWSDDPPPSRKRQQHECGSAVDIPVVEERVPVMEA